MLYNEMLSLFFAPMNAPRSVARNPLVEAAVDYASSLRLDAPWETNGQGQIILNPLIGLLHAKRAEKISAAIRHVLSEWHIWPEVGLHTSDGIKAPDLAVASPTFNQSTDERGFLLYAPELCIEVMSPSNSWEEMRHKTLLYLAAGAREVWICDNDGAMHFFDGAGERTDSALARAMPDRMD